MLQNRRGRVLGTNSWGLCRGVFDYGLIVPFPSLSFLYRNNIPIGCFLYFFSPSQLLIRRRIDGRCAENNSCPAAFCTSCLAPGDVTAEDMGYISSTRPFCGAFFYRRLPQLCLIPEFIKAASVCFFCPRCNPASQASLLMLAYLFFS